MTDATVERQRMVDSQIRARRISDVRVIEAMLRVPRHEFVPVSVRYEAYQDHPLPIGDGQTIWHPYVVALMLQSLQLKPTDGVLEVGTGFRICNGSARGTSPRPSQWNA
jgi:protein-L-isoaspartate(D-aspartate) O-methyltransferase